MPTEVKGFFQYSVAGTCTGKESQVGSSQKSSDKKAHFKKKHKELRKIMKSSGFICFMRLNDTKKPVNSCKKPLFSSFFLFYPLLPPPSANLHKAPRGRVHQAQLSGSLRAEHQRRQAAQGLPAEPAGWLGGFGLEDFLSVKTLFGR